MKFIRRVILGGNSSYFGIFVVEKVSIVYTDYNKIIFQIREVGI